MEFGDVHGHLQQVSGFKDANIDIVAVHGLNPGLNAKNVFKHETSHAKKTWTGDNNVCWLSNDKYLPSKLPNARVFIFEYNSNVAFNTLKSGINDTANLLLNDLFLERQHCPHRPLVFICHSLGGLVVKRVFVKAQPKYKDIAHATRLFIFFGTPHRGGHGADEGEYLSSFIRRVFGESKNSYMEVLQKDSEMARSIHEDFVNYLDVERHRILSLFESKGPIRYVDPIVSQNSATFGLGSPLEETLELPTDHSNICKFSVRDHRYEKVEKNVVYLVEWAIHNDANSSSSLYNPSSDNKSAQEEENETSASLDEENIQKTRNSSVISNDSFSFFDTAGYPRSHLQANLEPSSEKSLKTAQSATSLVPYSNLDSTDRIQTPSLHSLGHYERDNAVSFAVPYERNHLYVNRQTLMDELESFLTAQDDFQSKVALYGLGGVGKTQIAIEIAFRYRQRYPEESIYWIQADNCDRLRQSFSVIAEKALIPGYNDERVDHVEIVKNWLRHPKNGKWLMIIDNADDIGAFQSRAFPADRGVSFESGDFLLPDCIHGTFLITTRDRKIAFDFAGHHRAVQIPKMTQEESSNLIRGLPGSVEDSNKLMRELEYLPLALSQAAAFMYRNGMRINTYLEMICDEGHVESLLGESFKLHGREKNVPNAVTTTWKISFDQIQRQSPNAAELLSLLAFFDRQGIPKSLLQVGQDRLQLEKSLGILKSFSLITENVVDKTIHIHRLTQITIRLWLRASGLENQLAEKAMDLLSTSFPSGKYGTWPQCKVLLPHALAITQNSLIRQGSSEKFPLLLSSIGRYQDFRNDLAEAEKTCRDALSFAKKIFWDNDDNISKCCEPLIEILRHQGELGEAEDLAREQLKSATKKKSHKDERVLNAMLSLSKVLQDQGKYSEATEWALKVMKQREKASMELKPNIADCANRLSSCYDHQGKYFEAEKQALRCISERIDFYGPNDPTVYKAKFRLAFILGHQRRHLESELLIREVIENQNILLGPDARDARISQWALARILRDIGSAEKLEQAEKILSELMDYVLKLYGPWNPDFLTVKSDLAMTMLRLERYHEAEKFSREVLEARNRSLRTNHPGILTSKSRLATVLRCREKYAEAEAIELEVLKQRSGNKKGLFHSLPIGCFESYHKLGLIYADWPGHERQAYESHMKAFEGWKKALSWQHPDTQRSAAEITRALRRLGRFSELKRLESDMAKHMNDGSLESSSMTSLSTRNSESSREKKVG